ncbi:MAG: UbiX family flavin prenyltransferase [Promethearchaeota archaeon]
MKIIVAITGASGVIYGIRLLEVLRDENIETALIISEIAKEIISWEVEQKKEEIEKLASKSYKTDEFFTELASGTFLVDAMVIIPCSMKTLSAIANGFSSNLITRAADCVLKEGRKLILVPRETPLSMIHLENMLRAKRSGAIILPAMPAFYHKPKNIDELTDFVIGKILDQIGIKHDLFARWKGR